MIGTLFRSLGAFLGAIHGTFRGVLRLSPRLLGAALRLVVFLLRSLLHAVSRVLGRVLGLVARVLHVLFGAAVLVRVLLAPSKSRCTHQGGSEKYRWQLQFRLHIEEGFPFRHSSWLKEENHR